MLFILLYSLIISEDQFLVLKRECMSCLIVLLTRYFLWEDGPGLEKGGGGGDTRRDVILDVSTHIKSAQEWM